MKIDYLKSLTKNIIEVVLVIAIIMFLLKCVFYHWQLITFPWQIEYREGAFFNQTKLMLAGLNPFSLINQPQSSTQYGIVYPLVTTALAKIFGNSLFLHRIVSGLAIISSLTLIFFMFDKVSLLIRLSLISLMYVGLLDIGSPLGTIDALGFFLFIMAFFIPYKNNYSYKSLFICVILGILAFYTKAYFLLVLPALTVYLFFNISKKKAFIFVIFSAFAGLISIYIVNRFFETYFREILLNIAPNFKFSYLIFQTKLFIRQYLFFCVGFSSLFIITIAYNKQRFYKNIFLFFACISGLVLLKMGGNDGSSMVYYNQLLLPFLLLFASSMLVTKSRKFSYLFVLLILIDLYRWSPDIKFINVKDYSKQWASVGKYLDSYRNVYSNTPVTTVELIKRGKEVNNSGLSDYFLYGTKSNSFFKAIISPTDDKVLARYEEHISNINSKIAAGNYDLIILDNKPSENIDAFYKEIDKQEIIMPHTNQKWMISFWVKK